MKKAIMCIAFVAFTITFFYIAGILLRPTNTDIAFNTIDTFHALPLNSLEVIAYGSSHIWRGLDVMEMYKNYGIGAYSYGCNWQHINTTSLFFYDSLRTQHPKIILIDTYCVNDLLLDTNINGEIYYTQNIKGFNKKYEYLKQCFGNNLGRYLSYYIPLLAFHENWVNLQKDNFTRNCDNTNFFQTMGYLNSNEILPIELNYKFDTVQKELSATASSLLDDIVKTCQENDIQIIFYTIPWQGYFAYSDAMYKYAEENNCVYINLFNKIEEIGLNSETDFSDVSHLNSNGAKKIADYLGAFIVKHYNVTDMRQVKNNIWAKYLDD